MTRKIQTTVAILAVALLAAAMLTGCGEGPMTLGPGQQSPPQSTTRPVAMGQAPYLAPTNISDADGAPMTFESACESAVKWSERCAQAKEKLAVSEQENRELQDREQKLQVELKDALLQLKDAQNQLKEANLMLQDMKGDLEKWKASVMGFRQEMRDAQTAQMVALTRIVKLLNGEMPPTPAMAPATPPTTTQPAESTAVSAIGKEKN